MYKQFRNIHLALGLFAALFLALYGFSALQLSLRNIFDRVSPTTIYIDVPAKSLGDSVESADKMRAWMKNANIATGKLGNAKTTSTAVAFDVYRPGIWSKVSYERGAEMVQVQRVEASWIVFGIELHEHSGLWHEDPAMKAWGVLVLLMSLATLGIALSGLLMWFRRNNERRIGGVILAASVVFTGVLMVYIRG